MPIVGITENEFMSTGGFPGRTKCILAIILAVISIAIYFPSLNYNFVYDDNAVLTQNQHVTNGLAGLKSIWTTSYFHGYNENMNARAYRPIPLTTLALQYEFFKLNPKPYHALNLLLYGLTALILYLFLSRLLYQEHPLIPFFASIFFLLHPIHVEVVANIKSRDTLLGFLNFVLAAWLLLKYIDLGKVHRLILSLGFYMMGLFSKEEIITTLAIIPLMLYFFRQMKAQSIAKLTLPYLLALGIFLWIRSWVLGGFNAGVTLNVLDNSLLAAENSVQQMASTIFVAGNFLLKVFFPHPLLSDYSFSTLPIVNWDDWRVYASAIAYLFLISLAAYGFKKRKLYSFAALFYLISVSVFLSILTMNVSAYNDRFLYTPSLGISLLLIWALTRWFGNSVTLGNFLHCIQRNFGLVTIASIISLAAFLKIQFELPDWTDEISLFSNDAPLAPDNARLRKNYGGALTRLAVKNQGENPELTFKYAQLAIVELEAALKIYPEMPTGQVHLGISYLLTNDLQNGERALRNALELSPRYYFALTNLANLLYRKGDYEGAISTLHSMPDSLKKAGDYHLLSISHQMLGEKERAAYFKKLSSIK